VLEQVSETSASPFFVLGSDVIPDVDGNEGNRVIFVKNDL
jgi:hypothetical protein